MFFLKSNKPIILMFHHKGLNTYGGNVKFVAEEMGVKLDYYYSIIKNYSELKEMFKDCI